MISSATLCLQKTAIELLEKVSDAHQHPGLKLDKLSCAGKQEKQIEAIRAVCACTGDPGLLKTMRTRRGAMLDGLGARRFCGQTRGSLALHLARPNALENAGFALHPIYGFAVLPGTGLKGITRAWAETVWKPGEADQKTAEARIRAAFGTPDAAGRITFHDAWPIQWPRLEADILNSHHSEYYKEGAKKEPPGDWEGPIPVYFLTVANDIGFEFALSDRINGEDDLLEQTVSWMGTALEHAGFGAKTAAGYGRIVPRSPRSSAAPVPPLPGNDLRHEHRLTLASPAFLAGARQDRSDCDLRPASLRGLLRWWWRTMHAKHLSTKDLARLEAVIWGDTQRGSAVRLSLQPESGNKPAAQYNKQSVENSSSLPKPRDRKTIQGLFYTSYGMNENKQEARYYCHHGDRWALTLTTGETRWPAEPAKGRAKIKVPPALVMRQAEAALWLLTRFGGVGSKSRKGFGSFEDVSVEGIDNIEHCCAVGRELRKHCDLETQDRDKHGKELSTLETRIGPVEIETPWKDPWFALDRMGQVYQRFIKTHGAQDRAVFGLPRKGAAPPSGPDRLASPIHWSLTRRNNKLLIRLIAFRDVWPQGQDILDGLREFAKRELSAEVETYGTQGVSPPRINTQAPPRELKVGEKIQAELLDEKTKKGGWRAKEIRSGIVGNIQNSDKVPADAQAGQEVELIVKINNPGGAAFQWPMPAKEKQSKPAAKRNQKGKKGKGARR